LGREGNPITKTRKGESAKEGDTNAKARESEDQKEPMGMRKGVPSLFGGGLGRGVPCSQKVLTLSRPTGYNYQR